MEASKLTISPETIRFQKMTPGKRADLRRRNIIEYIESKPFGTPIKLSEFAAVGAFGIGSAHALIKTMIKKGVISKDHISRYKVTYVVNGSVVTKTPPKAEVTKEQTLTTPVVPRAADPIGDRTLAEFAKDFAWEKASDSLREFVAYMDGKELDLRRMLSGGGGTN